MTNYKFLAFNADTKEAVTKSTWQGVLKVRNAHKYNKFIIVTPTAIFAFKSYQTCLPKQSDNVAYRVVSLGVGDENVYRIGEMAERKLAVIAYDLLLNASGDIAVTTSSDGFTALWGDMKTASGGAYHYYASAGAAIEEPVIEEPVIEEPVIEEPVIASAAAAAIEEPAIEEPAIEEPAIEEPAAAVWRYQPTPEDALVTASQRLVTVQLNALAPHEFMCNSPEAALSSMKLYSERGYKSQLWTMHGDFENPIVYASDVLAPYSDCADGVPMTLLHGHDAAAVILRIARLEHDAAQSEFWRQSNRYAQLERMSSEAIALSTKVADANDKLFDAATNLSIARQSVTLALKRNASEDEHNA